METVLHGRSALYKNPLIEIYTEEDGKFKGRQFLRNVFGWLPTVIFKAANLNLTFDDSQVKTGDAYINGSFDGVYGLLQKNKSDFSAVPLSLEALRGDFECPVKVITFDAETQHRVISSPSYNRTKIIFDIEDSISNIKTDVFVLLIFLFFFTRIVISGLRKLDSDGAMSMIMKEFTVKRYPKFLSWRAFRSVLQQGMDLRFPLASQSVIFCTFGIAASTLITLYHNHMSADLVSYSKPHLLNSLLDVWNAGNSVKVSFTEASNIASSFQKSPNGSLQNKIYQRSLNQWKGAAENFHLMPSSVLLRGSDLVTKEKVALLTQTAPIGILLGLECKDVFDSHPSPLKYSSIHVSKNVILTENFVFVTSLFIIPELEKRLLKYNRLASESGLIEMNLRRGPEFAVENIPLGRQPSMSCLHTKAWEDGDQGREHVPLELQSCSRFLTHIIIFLCFAGLKLVTEIFVGRISSGKTNPRKRKRKRKNKRMRVS